MQINELFPLSDSQVVSDFMTSMPLSTGRNCHVLSATAESQVQSNVTTCTDKVQGCGQSTQKPKSSKKLAADSTLTAKNCLPYWTEQCREISSQLWLPTVTDWQDSGLDLLSISSNKQVEKSWFSTQQLIRPSQNLPKTCLPSYTTSRVDYMEVGAISTCKKVRIYPTAEQRNLFVKWFGISRLVYNLTVEHLNQPKELRQTHWMGAAKPILASLPDFAKEVPYQVKKMAVSDAFAAFSNGCRKFKSLGKPFSLSFRSRKAPKQSCFIPKSAVLDSGIYPRIAGKLKYSEELPEEILDSRLIYDNGRWFIAVPTKSKRYTIENQENVTKRIVALDPGVRTFLTGYSPVECFKLGEHAIGRISRLCSHLDDLQSRIDMSKGCQKRRMRKAAHRMRNKIKDLVNEMHWKSANYLVHNYDIILLPTFETSDMVSRAKRKLNKKSVRQMLTLSHFSFKMRIKHLANKFGKTVIDVNEAYTSKTASWTGEIKYNLGGAKAITSSGISLDRDINGARGILLRALVETPSLFEKVCIS